MRDALIAVDVQQDFISGSLGGEGRDSVISPIARIAASPDVVLVVASRDWHPPNHCSFAAEPEFRDGSWPRHCVAHSEGATISPLIRRLYDFVVSKGTDPDVEQYSAFDGFVALRKWPQNDGAKLTLPRLLQAAEVDRVIVTGLTVEYCVKETAIGAVNATVPYFRNSKVAKRRLLELDVVVPLDACAGVALETASVAVTAMLDAGVEIVVSWRDVVGDTSEERKGA